MSDRRKYHIDKRAEEIFAKLVHGKLSDDQLLDTRQTAKLLGVSMVWLELLRRTKRGPKVVVLGPRCIKYRVADLKSWLKARTRASREAA